MKKRILLLVMVLLFTLSLGTSALATWDYGVIYDETEMLGSDKLAQQGEQTLPQLTETLGLDLRVDVLTMISDDNIGDTAAWLYEAYEYGYGEAKEGVSLTILLEMQDAGNYAMPSSNGWCVYASLSEERGDSQELANVIRDAVEPYMAPELWSGEDISISADALTQAVDAMAAAAEDFILANCPPDGSAPEVTEAPGQSGGGMQYVYDVSGLLTYEQWQELEHRAQTISQRHHCGVYFAIVDDYTDYGDGSVYETTYQLYHNSGLGYGLGRDGIIVLLSMEERDYAMFVYGEWAEYAFDRYGAEQLENRFLSNFSDGDWYGGISNYLTACDEFLELAEAGKPVRSSPLPTIGIAVAVSCLIAFLVCMILKGQMKSVRKGVDANVYTTAGGGLKLTDSYDHYTHTTETRRKIESDSGGGGRSSGGTVSRSGGGGHGRSGKF